MKPFATMWDTLNIPMVGYSYENNEDVDFKFTTAHEIGHEILKSYGGTAYSYGHKGSVNVVTQKNEKKCF